MRRRLAGAAAALLLLASPALAARWNVDPLTSRLMFTGEQAGEAFAGSFPKFTSTIEFDEAAPEKGSIRISIDMRQLQIDGKDRMDALPTADWFAVAQFPTAEFTSTHIRRAASGGGYLAQGTLTLRGIHRALTLPFRLTTTGNSTVARGEVALNRQDFGIGQGRWAGEEWVSHTVRVRFELHATAQ